MKGATGAFVFAVFYFLAVARYATLLCFWFGLVWFGCVCVSRAWGSSLRPVSLALAAFPAADDVYPLMASKGGRITIHLEGSFRGTNELVGLSFFSIAFAARYALGRIQRRA